MATAATKRSNRNRNREVEDIELDDDEQEVEVVPRERIIIVQKDKYDVREDWQVPHSGTTDPKTGAPRYDESPVKGGVYLNEKRQGNLPIVEEYVNYKGHEVDPNTGDRRTPAIVINPERYTQARSELEEAMDY